MDAQNSSEKQSPILARAVERESERDRIDAHCEAQTCSVCGKHLNYADGYYSVTHAHYACEFPTGYKSTTQKFKEAESKLDTAMANLGFKRKRQQAKIGEGGPTRKLKEIIEVSAKEHFVADTVSEISIYLPPPVWRQHRFDVMRVEGSMLVDGRKIMFGSWAGVSMLIQYRRVKFDNDWPSLGMSPDIETKRGRKNAPHTDAG